MDPAVTRRHESDTERDEHRLPLEEQQRLVLQYAPLVRKIARTLPLEIPGVLEYEDAVGYGTCGLVEAVRRYDPTKGTNFHAYAVRRIRGAMIDAFRRMDRLSRTMRQKARDIQRAQSELQAELGREPRPNWRRRSTSGSPWTSTARRPPTHAGSPSLSTGC